MEKIIIFPIYDVYHFFQTREYTNAYIFFFFFFPIRAITHFRILPYYLVFFPVIIILFFFFNHFYYDYDYDYDYISNSR